MLITAFATLVLATLSQCSHIEHGENAITLTSITKEQDKELWTGRFRALDDKFINQYDQPLANALGQVETSILEAINNGFRLDEVAVMALNAPIHLNNRDQEGLVRAAIAQDNHLVLRSLLYFPIWRSDALRHWFLALSYESKWCSKEEWKEYHEEADWVTNFCMALKADNVAHYQFLKSDQLLWAAISEQYPNIQGMIIKNDAPNILQSIESTDFKEIAQQIDCLVSHGAWKTIAFLESINVALDFSQIKMDTATKTAKGLESLYSRGYPKKPSKLTLQQLFIDGKVGILEAFLKIVPERMTEANLNLVTMAGSEATIPMLKWAFRRGLREADLSVYFHYAAANNCTKALGYLSTFDHYIPPNDVLLEAASKGSVDALQWARNAGGMLNYQELLNEAISSGQKKVIEWVLQKQSDLHPAVNALDKLCGLEIGLELLRDFCRPSKLLPSRMGLHNATRNGHLKTVQWILNIDESLADAECIDLATEGGHVELLNWFTHYGIPVYPSNASRQKAASGGHLDVIELVAPLLDDAAHREILHAALIAGHLHIVKWLCEELGVWPAPDDYMAVAELGHFTLFKWLVEKNPAKLAEFGSIDNLLASGRMDILGVIVDQGYGYSITNGISNVVAKNGHFPALQWLKSRHEEIPTQDGLDGAIENGHLTAAHWIFTQKSDLQVKLKSVNVAATKGHLGMLKWAHGRGVVPDVSSISIASLEGNGEIENWFYLMPSIEKDKGQPAILPPIQNGRIENNASVVGPFRAEGVQYPYRQEKKCCTLF